MSPTPQAVTALVASIVCFQAAIQAVLREWRVRELRALNAVSFVWLGVSYFVGLSALLAAYPAQWADEYSMTTNVLAVAAVCCGVLGVTMGARNELAFTLPRRLPLGFGGVRQHEWYLACFTLGAVALTSRALAFGRHFVFGMFSYQLPRAWGGYVDDLRTAMLPAGLIAVHLLARSRPPLPKRLLLYGVLVVALAYSALQFSRRPLVLLIIGALVYLVHTGRIAPSRLRLRGVLLGLGVAVLFLVVLFAAVWRWFTLQMQLPIDIALVLPAIRHLGPAAVSLDAYNVYLSCVSWFTLPSDWLLGGSFVQAFTNAVPRSLWVDKPESFAFTIAKLMGTYSTNYGPTAFGEGYANFGLLGTFLFGWILGFVARILQQYQETSATSFGAVLTAMLSFEMFGEVRGDLQAMTTPLLEHAGLLALCLWVVTRLGFREPSPARLSDEALSHTEHGYDRRGQHGEQEGTGE